MLRKYRVPFCAEMFFLLCQRSRNCNLTSAAVVHDLCAVSVQLHVSSREGLWILEKYDINVIPLEATLNSYFLCYLKSATTMWLAHEFVKREQHRRRYSDAITTVIGDVATPSTRLINGISWKQQAGLAD